MVPWILHPRQVEAMRRRADYAEQQRRTLEEEANAERLRAERSERRRNHEEQAYYSLLEAMEGKKLDATWRTYATTVVKDYLDKQNIVDPKTRVEIIRDSIRKFIDQLHTEDHMSLIDIIAMRQHNSNIKGSIDQTVWWNPWTWHKKIELSENSNSSSRVPSLYSGTQVAMIGLGVVTVGLAGLYYSSRVYSSLTNIITTPKTTLQQLSPLQIDMPQLNSLNTSLQQWLPAIATSRNLDDIPRSSLDDNTSIELMIQLSANFMNALLKILRTASDAARQSDLFRR
ncbi:hypothetical protein QAD02_008567 [Eretmocerus hayati]|uniref:Uncharacterized protein n=1 Tax=Eretmocerus hayati TaxID=131215 RepID=A0ACC2N6T4_9HYME|nr:hypothetical protein QAD02_008567 [Eretmocerus hayati]